MFSGYRNVFTEAGSCVTAVEVGWPNHASALAPVTNAAAELKRMMRCEVLSTMNTLPLVGSTATPHTLPKKLADSGELIDPKSGWPSTTTAAWPFTQAPVGHAASGIASRH